MSDPIQNIGYPRHLDTPLLLDGLEFYNKYPARFQAKYPKMKDTMVASIDMLTHDKPEVFSWIERAVKSSHYKGEKPLLSLWKTTCQAALQSLQWQSEALVGEKLEVDLFMIEDLYRSLETNTDLLRAYTQKAKIISFHEELHSEVDINEEFWHSTTFPWVAVHKGWVVLSGWHHSPSAVPFNLLLCALDKLEAHFSFLLYCNLTMASGAYDGFNYLEFQNTLYSYMDIVHEELGNKSTEFKKALESLSVGMVLRDEKQGEHQQSFLDEMLTGLHNKDPILEVVALRWISLFEAVKYLPRQLQVKIIMESYGHEKLHFYPMILTEDGVIKMYKYGTGLRTGTYQGGIRLDGELKKSYIIGYFRKEGRIPPIWRSARYHPAITRLIERGNPGSFLECNKIPVYEWSKIRFKEHLDFNYHPDVVELIDDKSISPHLENLYAIYERDALLEYKISFPKSRPNTRLILELLERDTIDVERYFQQVKEHGRIPVAWAVIQLMAKERELKLDPRVFSILTFELRMMASCLEKNIMDGLLRYFPQQSMTMSGPDLHKRIAQLNTLKTTPGKVWVYLHLDMEQWNYTFRPLIQAPFLQTLDSIFGTTNYRYAMQTFTDSLLVSANRFAPPESPGTFTSWSHHLGGNQGILQKLWSLMTIVSITRVMHDNELDYVLTGAGDNQVLAIHLSEGKQGVQMILRVKQALVASFEEIGLVIKAQESWHSSSLLCYQRKYYYQGVNCPNGLKQSNRAYAGTSDFSLGISVAISTAMNSGVSINQATVHPYVGVSFAYLEALSALVLSNAWGNNILTSKSLLTKITLVGSDFGFLPFMQLVGFLYSGHKDYLTHSLALLRALWTLKPELRPLIQSTMNFEIGPSDDSSLLALIEHPSSLNIRRPKTAETVIKTEVIDYLLNRGNVKNTQLASMFAALAGEEQLTAARELLKIRPIHLSVFHAIFEYSHLGQLLKSLNRFTKVSSIIKAVIRNRGQEGVVGFGREILLMDRLTVKHLLKRVAERPVLSQIWQEALFKDHYFRYLGFCQRYHLNPNCSLSARLFLIPLTYNLGDELIRGPFCPSPLEQLVPVSSPTSETKARCLIVYPAKKVPPSHREMENARGPFSLYIGSKTKDTANIIRLSGFDGLEVKSALEMYAKLASWLKAQGASPDILSLIDEQIGGRSHQAGMLVRLSTDNVIGGTLDHRLEVPGEIRGAYISTLSNISTWYRISSNLAVSYSRGSEDRYIFYQELYQFIYGIMRISRLIFKPKLLEIRLDCCSYQVNTARFDNNLPLKFPSPPSVSKFSIPTDKFKKLQAMLEYQSAIRSQSTLESRTPGTILASCMAWKLANILRFHNMGRGVTEFTGRDVRAGSTIFNVSVVRIMDFDSFFDATALYCINLGSFGTVSTLTGLEQLTVSLGSRSWAGFDPFPFNGLLDAVGSAGRLHELFLRNNIFMAWSPNSILLDFGVAVMKELSSACFRLRTWGSKAVILVPTGSPEDDLTKLLRMLHREFGVRSRQAKVSLSFLSAGQILSSLARWKYPPIEVVPSMEEALANARSRQDNAPGKSFLVFPKIQDHREGDFPDFEEWPILSYSLGNRTVGSWIVDETQPSRPLITSSKFRDGPLASALFDDPRIPGRGWLRFGPAAALIAKSQVSVEKVLVVGEGLGTVSRLVLHLWGQSVVLGVDKWEAEDHLPCELGTYAPSCVPCTCDSATRHRELGSSAEHGGDICDLTTVKAIQAEVRSIDSELSLLIWDIESESTDHISSIKQLLKVLSSSQPSWFYAVLPLAAMSVGSWLTDLMELQPYHLVVIYQTAYHRLQASSVSMLFSKTPPPLGSVKLDLLIEPTAEERLEERPIDRNLVSRLLQQHCTISSEVTKALPACFYQPNHGRAKGDQLMEVFLELLLSVSYDHIYQHRGEREIPRLINSAVGSNTTLTDQLRDRSTITLWTLLYWTQFKASFGRDCKRPDFYAFWIDQSLSEIIGLSGARWVRDPYVSRAVVCRTLGLLFNASSQNSDSVVSTLISWVAVCVYNVEIVEGGLKGLKTVAEFHKKSLELWKRSVKMERPGLIDLWQLLDLLVPDYVGYKMVIQTELTEQTPLKDALSRLIKHLRGDERPEPLGVIECLILFSPLSVDLVRRDDLLNRLIVLEENWLPGLRSRFKHVMVFTTRGRSGSYLSVICSKSLETVSV